MEIRSFLAFELPEEIKGIITHVSEDLRKSSPDLKWVRVDNIHLTLVFMGNVKRDDLPAIGDAARKVCQGYGHFNISMKGMGVFPNRRNPRVIWLGLEGDLERMSFLRDALQKHLRPFGIKEEKRRFKPHLTIGRFRKVGKSNFNIDEAITKYGAMTSPVCILKELILFKSDLKPTGAVYTKLETWPLFGEK